MNFDGSNMGIKVDIQQNPSYLVSTIDHTEEIWLSFGFFDLDFNSLKLV